MPQGEPRCRFPGWPGSRFGVGTPGTKRGKGCTRLVRGKKDQADPSSGSKQVLAPMAMFVVDHVSMLRTPEHPLGWAKNVRVLSSVKSKDVHPNKGYFTSPLRAIRPRASKTPPRLNSSISCTHPIESGDEELDAVHQESLSGRIVQVRPVHDRSDGATGQASKQPGQRKHGKERHERQNSSGVRGT